MAKSYTKAHFRGRREGRIDNMQYRRLGTSGLEVSRICLGCMSFGESTRGNHLWTLGEDQSEEIIRRALELGINFLDTANVYSLGSSEEILGRVLPKYANRDDLVIATKVHGRMRDGANGGGLSRKVIMREIDDSLRRLQTDFVDLYQIHRFDPKTPIEETLVALDDLVRVGKVRYIGASSMHAWQFSKMLYTQEKLGLTKFITMQNHYNLIYREEEREMVPLCGDQGVGLIPWSPLARGKLTRAFDATSARSETDEFGKTLYREEDREIVEVVSQIAQSRGVPMAQVAMAWILSKQLVSSPIVGVTKLSQLDDAVAAVALTLADAEIQALEAPYQPHSIAGHI